MADLNSLSDAELQYVANGQLDKLSDATLAKIAAHPASEPAQSPSWAQTIGKVVTNAGGEIADTAKAAADFATHYNMQTIPQMGANAILGAPGAIRDAAGGMMQYMRNLSPENMRGPGATLPGGEAENHPFLALGAGDTAPLKQEAVEHPLRLAGDVLGAASLTGAGREIIAKGLMAPVSGAKRIAGVLNKYDAAAAPLASDVKAAVGPAQLAQANRGKLTSDLYSEIAQSGADKASKDAARRAVVARQLVRQAESTAAPDIAAVGDASSDLTSIGSKVKNAAVANEDAIVAARGKADDELRAARDAVVADKEANGINITSTSAYKDLVKKLEPIANPNPDTMPAILQSTDPGRQSLYQELWNRLTPKQVKTSTGAIKTVTPGFKAVDEARTWLGQVFDNPQSGYAGLKATEQKRLYPILARLEEEYVGGTGGSNLQSSLQANWRSAAQNLKKFDTRAGKALTGEQGMTGAANVTPSEIPGRFFGKGQGQLQYALDATNNPAAVTTAARDWTAAKLAGKTSAQIAKDTSSATKLGDMLQHPSLGPLKQDIETYRKGLQRSETAAARSGMETTSASGKQTIATEANTAMKTTQNDAATAAAHQRDMTARAATYETMEPREVAQAALADITSDLKAGRISENQFFATKEKIDKANDLYGKTDKIYTAIKWALGGTATLSALTGAGHVAGVMK